VVQADPTTFPSGMAALASYIHSKGLLAGLYTDLGVSLSLVVGRELERTFADVHLRWPARLPRARGYGRGHVCAVEV
jgi:hypothetical protein